MSVGPNPHGGGSSDRPQYRKLPRTNIFSVDQLNPIRPWSDVEGRSPRSRSTGWASCSRVKTRSGRWRCPGRDRACGDPGLAASPLCGVNWSGMRCRRSASSATRTPPSRGIGWRLVHRHADALVHLIDMEHVAIPARGRGRYQLGRTPEPKAPAACERRANISMGRVCPHVTDVCWKDKTTTRFPDAFVHP